MPPSLPQSLTHSLSLALSHKHTHTHIFTYRHFRSSLLFSAACPGLEGFLKIGEQRVLSAILLEGHRVLGVQVALDGRHREQDVALAFLAPGEKKQPEVSNKKGLHCLSIIITSLHYVTYHASTVCIQKH